MNLNQNSILFVISVQRWWLSHHCKNHCLAVSNSFYLIWRLLVTIQQLIQHPPFLNSQAACIWFLTQQAFNKTNRLVGRIRTFQIRWINYFEIWDDAVNKNKSRSWNVIIMIRDANTHIINIRWCNYKLWFKTVKNVRMNSLCMPRHSCHNQKCYCSS